MHLLIISVLVTYALWLFYLAVMSLWRAKRAGTISRAALWMGYPILVIGALLDALVNITLMSVIFAELPKRWLVTQRLQYHIKRGSGWRQMLARWICSHLLDAFDPTGGHCD